MLIYYSGKGYMDGCSSDVRTIYWSHLLPRRRNKLYLTVS